MKLQVFFNYWRDFFNKKVKEFKFDSVNFKNIIKLNKIIKKIYKVYENSFLTGQSTWNSIVFLGFERFKTSIYRIISKIEKIHSKIEINDFLLKSTRPKKIIYKYSENDKNQIKYLYFDKKINLMNVFVKSTNKHKNISINTIRKILCSDKKWLIFQVLKVEFLFHFNFFKW